MSRIARGSGVLCGDGSVLTLAGVLGVKVVIFVNCERGVERTASSLLLRDITNDARVDGVEGVNTDVRVSVSVSFRVSSFLIDELSLLAVFGRKVSAFFDREDAWFEESKEAKLPLRARGWNDDDGDNRTNSVRPLVVWDAGEDVTEKGDLMDMDCIARWTGIGDAMILPLNDSS